MVIFRLQDPYRIGLQIFPYGLGKIIFREKFLPVAGRFKRQP